MGFLVVESAEQSKPSYDELVAASADRDKRISALEPLVAELSAGLGVDSRNSSKPPSSDGPGSRAERRRAERERRRGEPDEGPAVKKKRGGQAGHAGRGLEFTASPDVTEVIEPGECGSRHSGLTDASVVKTDRPRVVDIPAVGTRVTEFRVVSGRCGRGAVTAGDLPAGVAGGPVRHGPNSTAAAAFIHAHGQVGAERTAEAVNGLFSTAVSTGWIGKVAARPAGCLFGFEADAKLALLAAPVAPADETSVNTVEDDAAGTAAGRSFSPHVFTMRTEDVVWLGAGHTRGHDALDGFGLFDRYTGTLVSDDYNGYSEYRVALAARQSCNAHSIRSLRGVLDAEPGGHDWAGVPIAVPREGRAAGEAAIAAGRDTLTGPEIAEIHREYLMWAESGIVEDTGRRDRHGKRHPAIVLAERLKKKIDQVPHHLTDFRVPWTSNLAEQALRHVEVHLKISGCFRTPATTQAYCRIHSHLITTRLHGVPPMQAIRNALAGNAWTPLQPITTA